MSDKEAETEQSILTMMVDRMGLTVEQAQRCLGQAKARVEAASLLGVAGFWS